MAELLLLAGVVLLAMIWSRVGQVARAANTSAHLAVTTGQHLESLNARLKDIQQRMTDNNFVTSEVRQQRYDSQP
jgi:hypothetical protein